jgi:tetratricopeptide (TPR) repeat protein
MAIDKNVIAKEAQKFVAKGQFDKAILEWKKLIKEFPNDANLYNTIGDLCLKKDSKAEAVDAYQKAADLLASDGFTSKAIALYKKILNIDPKKIEAHLALGDMNAEKGLTSSALESYKIVADHYSHQKDQVKALGIFQKMADLNPSNISFRIKLADMYAKQDMKPEATKAYLEAADLHMSKDAFKEARQLFEKVLALDPNNKDVYHKAGIVYFKEGKFVEACKALKPAFESDPSNKELVDTYLNALTQAGRDAEVKEALKTLLNNEPGNAEFREKLYALYLAEGNLEKALAEASVLADDKTKAEETGAAEELLKTFVAENPEYVPGRRKLADFYASVNRADDAAGELLQAADLLIEEDPDEAKKVLGRVLELVPHLPEAQKRLELLSAQSAPPPTPAETAPEPETPQPTAASPAAAAEEDPAITEALTEADVLIKYGLVAKAAEQLESLVGKFPESPAIRVKLCNLYRELKNTDKAVRHALLASALYKKFGREDEAEAVLQAARQMAPDHPALLSRLERASSAGPQTPVDEPIVFEEPRIEPLDEEIAPAEPPQPESAHLPPDGNETPYEPPAEDIEAPQSLEPEQGELIEFEGLDAGIPSLDEVEPAPAIAEETTEDAAAPPPPPAQSVDQSVETDVGEIWAEAEFYFQQGLFDEAKKHYAKIIEITPSDKRALSRLTEISREEDETHEFSKLTEAVDDLENALSQRVESPDEMSMTASDEEAVRSLMQEIQQLKQAETPEEAPEEEPPAPPRPAAKRPERPEPARVVREKTAGKPSPPRQTERAGEEEDFFDLGVELQAENRPAAAAQQEQGPADDFFDLAAELRDELSTVVPAKSPASVPAEEQSLDDIFEEFKKGVEQQSVKEDADTHYNLGIAYREMGLLDDAIAEFIMTPEDEPKFIQSRYMLGLCYMEKGEYRNAIGEIQNALDYSESLGEDNPNYVGMHYDLGLACQGVASNEQALREFKIVYDADPHYRDVTSKIKELQQGGFISLDQIKNDIEKEISSTFFAEGERIEREEKNRKSEKVKN